MNINEIKSGNYYTNGHGVYVMASGAVQDNEFQATNIELGQVRMYPISEFSHCTFHEAFRDNVNRIVLEAVTSQNMESLYDHTGRNSLAVSDMQKKWILDHFVHKHDLDKGFLEFVKLSEAHSVLICEYKDLQGKFIESQEKVKELKTSLDNQSRDYISLKEKVLKNQHVHNDSVWYIGELKKFIQHLQDYIASKYLENEGLILEKFIQEESDNGRKEST